MEKCIVNTNYMNDGFIIKNTDGEDEIIHIPYNLNNVLVNESDIIQILNQYNVIILNTLDKHLLINHIVKKIYIHLIYYLMLKMN